MRMNQGDTAPDLTADLAGSGGAADLTTASEIRVKGYQSGVEIIDRVVVGDDQGAVTMEWETGDTAIARPIGFKWEVTWPDGKIQTFPAKGLSWVEVSPDP